MVLYKRKSWAVLGLASLIGPLAPLDLRAEAQETGQADSATVAEKDGEGGGGVPTTYALSSTNSGDYKYEARAEIAGYVNLVHDSYVQAARDAAAMQSAIQAFLDKPGQATLEAARASWVAARPAYMRTEAFRFYNGPIDRLEGRLNSWPLNEAYLDSVAGKPDSGLVNDPGLTLDAKTLPALNQKQDEADVTTGWHAIEFLLWGQDMSATGPGNRPFTDYVPGTASTDRRRILLSLTTDDLVTTLGTLEAEWRPDSPVPNAATAFLALAPREAVGRMVNGMAILAGYEFMSERLGVALDSGDQEDEQSCFSDTTRGDFIADLDGIRAVWTGKTADKTYPALEALVRRQDPALADQMNALVADATQKVNALGSPWDQTLASPPGSPQRAAAEALVISLQNLSTGLVKTGNRLGVLVLVPNG